MSLDEIPVWVWIALGAVVLLVLVSKRGASAGGGVQQIAADPNVLAFQTAQTQAQAGSIHDYLQYLTDIGVAQSQAEQATQIAQIQAASYQQIAAQQSTVQEEVAKILGGNQVALTRAQAAGQSSSFWNQAGAGALAGIFQRFGSWLFGGSSGASGSSPSGGSAGGGVYASAPFNAAGLVPVGAGGLPNWYGNIG